MLGISVLLKGYSAMCSDYFGEIVVVKLEWDLLRR